MTGCLSVISVLATLGARTATLPSACSHKVPLMFGRFTSRGASKVQMAQNGVRKHFHYEEDEDFMMEEVEDKLETLLEERKKTQKAIKYNIIKRKMMPSGAPERKLTWQAIEQIRYLKQEQPDEWSVKRLAEGFSVTPDVIVRVLKSKFIPDPDRKIKQDVKVMTRLNRQVLPSGSGEEKSRIKLHRGCSAAALPPGNQENGLVPVAAHTSVSGDTSSGILISGDTSSVNKSLAVASAPVTVPATYFTSVNNKDATGRRSAEDDSSTDINNSGEEDGCWQGQVLSEEEIEQFWDMKKPTPVVQVGKDFFDGEGNFLYRI
ncbi:neugrin [Dunckerocampus dactyliophorus]|uniref:neugrin n=1 Tax=Dunckerocampus dactyliophorus TaxID=161453 RepID=UPI002406BE50|nr:neugrin [Dunckerocampus dactyliophorus]